MGGMNIVNALLQVRGGLIVSCQALDGEPLHGPMLVAALARAVALGGAVGIRTNGVEEVEVIKLITGLPVIGLEKVEDQESRVCITPTFGHAKGLVEAGAAMVAVDVRKERPFGEPLDELIPRIRQELGVPVLADCGNLDDAEVALAIGVDALAPTFGFLEGRLGTEPDFRLLGEMIKLGPPVIAEGGFWYPEQVVKAFELGAWAVVVGTAITRPMDITRRFVKALKGRGIN